MKKLSGIKVLLCWSYLLITCFAQTGIPKGNEVINRIPERKLERPITPPDQISPQPVLTKRGALPFKKKVSREQKKLLQVSFEELNRYATFLQNPNTGLIKLFSDIGCEDNANIVRADVNCLQSIPMSAFYSFREKEYTNDFLSDIRLKDNVLITDGLLTQGILVALGDAALETVSLVSDGMKFINDFTPEAQSGEALKQTKQLLKGVKSDKFIYKKSLPARENMTYALRVVAYRGRIIQTFRGYPFDMLAGDERVDITIAFRIVKKDEAGNLTLLWKELARKDAPKVIFPRRGRKSI